MVGELIKTEVLDSKGDDYYCQDIIILTLSDPLVKIEAYSELSKRKHMIGKIIMIIGILGVLLGGAVLLISLLLPVITDGRTSWDEALLGIIPGAVVLTGSFVIFIGGLITMLMQRKKKTVTA